MLWRTDTLSIVLKAEWVLEEAVRAAWLTLSINTNGLNDWFVFA